MSGTFHVATAADMEAFGRRLAALLKPGDVISLNGALGAGKTLLVSGIAQALGVATQITSPTFLVVRSYDDGVLPLTHVDVYRLGSVAEFTDLEVIHDDSDGVVVIEWGEAVRSALPDDLLSVDIAIESDGARSLTLTAEGSWQPRLLQGLTA